MRGQGKGRVSKWLREQLQLSEPQKLLSRSYFASTTGTSTAQAVEAYLSGQSAHHGYADRIAPPIFVHRFPSTPADERRLSPRHAVTVLHFHLVLSTWLRRGVFGRAEGAAIAQRWRQLQDEQQFALEKVSFVPDHVHLAVRVHPSVSPASLVLALMNAAQELVWAEFSPSAIRAGVPRLWQPSAHIGTYGDLQSPAIAAYIRRWSEHPDD